MAALGLSIHSDSEDSGSHFSRGFPQLNLNNDFVRSLMYGDEMDEEVRQRVERLSLMNRHANSSHGSTDSSWDTSSPPGSPFYASSVTSFDFERDSDADMRSAGTLSPAPSLYSLTSSMRDIATRTEYGRAVNTYSEIYRLAADEEEAQRLGE